jgi:RHS repeat-associated protein
MRTSNTGVGEVIRLTRRMAVGLLCVMGPLGTIFQAQSYLTSTGRPGFAMPYPAEMGTVDAASGNLHLEIPLGTFPQRGASAFVPKLLYDSHIWTVPTDGASKVWTTQGNLYGLAFGTWGFSEGGAAGLYLMASSSNGCNEDMMLWGDSGTQHFFNIPGTLNGSTCSGGTGYATDSSGYQTRQTPWNTQGLNGIISVYAPDGTEVFGGDLYPSGIAAKDPNGNALGLTYATISPPGIYNPVIDTLGRKVVNVLNNIYTSPMTLQVMNSQGGTSNYVITFTTIPVKTNFQEPGVTECNNNCTAEVIQSIGLPDGSQYSFLYDCDSTLENPACNSSGGLSGYYGTLTSMTLPTGAQVTYSYSMYGGVSWGSAHNEFPSRWLASKSSSAGTWTYTPVATAGAGPQNICLPNYQVGCQQVTVARPDGSKEVSSFIVDPVGGSWPQRIQSYNTDGVTLLSTVNNTWAFSNVCTLNLCGGLGYQDVRKLSTSTTLPIPGGNLTKQTTYTYDSPQTGNITAIKEWKYQFGTAPTFSSVPDGATYVTYASIGTNNNINRHLSQTVCNNVGTDSNCPGGGSTVARTTITYDAYGSNGSLALASVTGVKNHDDTNFGISYTTRGNPTQVSRWVTGNTYLTTALSYDSTGQVVQVRDPLNNATTYSYADTFYDDSGADPPAPHSGAPTTNAYLSRVTDAIGSISMGYYYGSGRLALSTDYDAVTAYSHYRDPFDRPTETDYPIGWDLSVYTSPTQVDSYAAIGDTSASSACVSCTHTQAQLDGLGRPTTQSLVNNPAGQVYVNATYNGVNRVLTASHPNFGPSDPNDVVERSLYDGLGRSMGVTHPDGQFLRTAYGSAVGNLGGVTTQQSSTTTYGYGYPVISLDEAGKQKQEWIDGFGHVIEVDEPAGSGSPGTGSVAISGIEKQVYQCPSGCHFKTCCSLVWDSGTVSITVNGYTASANFGYGSTTQSVATALASALNSSGLVEATANGSTITITALGLGSGTNYSLSASSHSSVTGGSGSFTGTPSGSTLTGGTGGISSSPLVTTYSYDALGNLTGVVQGSQTRSYQYDGLSRLTQEITPEAGTVTISYVTSGNSLCSGNPSNPCTRTSPAPNQTGTGTVTTTYTYNTATQLKQKTHSDTTGTEVYTYGTSAASFNVGRLVSMTDPSGSEAYSYDPIGRLVQLTKVVGSTGYITRYTYNAGGELTAITYPSGRVVQYSYDNVGHLCLMASVTTNCSTSTNPYLTLPSTSYDAAGRPLSATYGNGVVATAAYSPQTAELSSLTYVKGSTTLFGLNYYYQQNSTSCPTGNNIGNNGQINCISDVSSGTGDSGRSIAYTYDPIGRLATANTTGSSQYPAWGLAWTYDRYGNRTAQTVTAGSGYASSFIINPVNNQITSPAYTYDASGNVIAEPSPLSASYSYDGEECNTGYIGNGNNATYTCDGNDLRVKKVVTGTNAVTTLSIRSGGQVIAEYDNGAALTAPTREYLYGNNLLAVVTGSTSGSGGTIVYQQRDHLSARLLTDANGNDVGEQGAYPFGESWYNNSSNQTWAFTTYERDAESGIDYALARSYANTQGRFLSADPLQGHVGDPQSWNRYAYVENDPINLSDPTGQSLWDDITDLFGGEDDDNSKPQVAFIQGTAIPVDISSATWQTAWPNPGSSWTAYSLSINGNQLLWLLKMPVLDTIQESNIAELGLEVQNFITLSSVSEVAVKGIQGAQLVEGLWNLPSVVRSGLSLIRGPGIQTLGLEVGNVAEETTALQPYYPPNNGFLGQTSREFLYPGQQIDRFGGSDASRFFSPTGTPEAARSLPTGSVGQSLRTFEVVKPFEVESGTVAPAFGQPGFGTQFRTPVPMGTLIRRGIIRQITF